MPEHEGAKPYVNEAGVLVIPRDCDEKYRWWAGGQKITATLIELRASEDVWSRNSHDPYPEELRGDHPSGPDPADTPTS
ncbi:hypothetical protein GGQ74_002451 [Desulfobaculum xiamenense]|uniref:Uncharacterized protein n=1 Tax=Desulfobaculum xiamenense TaxID=995050 RepID=A0A846QKR5_9BACT|nr:hypothetical protein [Desulfobaculum xiamenense]NJB68778.1 hypothetical protein [Desulfobaculum xiamenense]